MDTCGFIDTEDAASATTNFSSVHYGRTTIGEMGKQTQKNTNTPANNLMIKLLASF